MLYPVLHRLAEQGLTESMRGAAHCRADPPSFLDIRFSWACARSELAHPTFVMSTTTGGKRVRRPESCAEGSAWKLRFPTEDMGATVLESSTRPCLRCILRKFENSWVLRRVRSRNELETILSTTLSKTPRSWHPTCPVHFPNRKPAVRDSIGAIWLLQSHCLATKTSAQP